MNKDSLSNPYAPKTPRQIIASLDYWDSVKIEMGRTERGADEWIEGRRKLFGELLQAERDYPNWEQEGGK